jgi:lipoprotein NlpD
MRILVLTIMTSFLMACAGHTPAPVAERYQDSELAPDSYYVLRGDTLFSVAFRYGKTVEQLASYNNIRAPYTIYVGQKLLLTGREPIPISKISPSFKSAKSKPVKSVKTKPTLVVDSGGWHWPLALRADISQRFVSGNSNNKGIDIVAKAGTKVLAARGGQVVYAGSGLPGYGNLLIIKHDAQYLSAYAHNQRLLVKEGQNVTAKQHVADLGSTATSSPKLHFEIRKDGKPVDPLSFVRQP